MIRLISFFNEVKRTYFPRWDPTTEWQVRRKTRLSDGYNTKAMCNRKTKTIEISRRFIAEDDNELRWILAHEMCHAVAKGNHTQKWQTRFLKVADRAELLGQKQLAERIRKDVKHVQNAAKPTVGSIRHGIEGALNNRPDASFEEVIEFVAYNWDYTADGLLMKYAHLDKYFYKIKKDALEYQKLREKYNTGNLC